MKRSLRTLAAPMAGALMLIGTAASVSADDTADFSIDAQAADNVCSVELSAETFDLGDLTWNQGWPSTTLHADLGYTLTATGGPGDRDCVADVSNSDFNNADDSVTLLSASAMTLGGGPLPATFPFLNMPVPGITSSVGIDVNTASANQNAPEDIYTSTLTVTFTVAP